jgi:hypothetical protein
MIADKSDVIKIFEKLYSPIDSNHTATFIYDHNNAITHIEIIETNRPSWKVRKIIQSVSIVEMLLDYIILYK